LQRGTIRPRKRHIAAECWAGLLKMVAREYLLKQAMTLFNLAKSVKDPNLSAGLLAKAADLEERAVNQAAPSPLVTPALKDQPAD
jgi:hypothetical protein